MSPNANIYTQVTDLRFWNSSMDSPDSADFPETVSGAAEQTPPNHAQESQDDMSSHKLLQINKTIHLYIYYTLDYIP